MSANNNDLFVPAEEGRPRFSIKFSAEEFSEEIETAEQLIEILKNLPDYQVYDAAKDYFEIFCDKGKEFLENVGIDLYKFIRDGDYWQGHDTLDEFEQTWQAAKNALDRRESSRRYIQSVFNNAVQLWPQDAQKIMVRAQTKTFAEKISKFVTKKVPFDAMQLAVNNEILKRLETALHHRGIRNLKAVMQGDLDNAKKRMDLTPLTESRLERFNLALDEDGFCCEYGRGVRQFATRVSMRDARDAVMTDILEDADIGRQLRPRPDKRKSLADDDDISEDDESEDNAEQPEPSPSKKPRAAAPSQPAPCGCMVRKTTLADHLTKVEDVPEKIALLAFRAIARTIRNSGNQIDTNSLCAEHSKRLSKLLHLYANGSHGDMTHRLDVLYSRSGNWDVVKREYAEWFKPVLGGEVVSCFRFEPKPLVPIVADFGKLDYLSFEDLFARCYGTSDRRRSRELAKKWQREGSVVLPLFRWLSEDWDGQHPNGLMSMIDAEMRMYDWHYRSRPRAPRVGWAKNSWFSLIQQLVRQDLMYYMFYVFLRPDHLWTLISFPYYSKSTHPGEMTAFRHIDVNVTDLLTSGRCANTIQGSVTLADENKDNCTILLLGMQHCLGDWWKDLKDRGYAKDGLIHKVTKDMWTDNDAAKFGIQWERQICRAGDVRISLPHIPHGSTGPATTNRRTILPWFVGIREDHETLECVESGGWTELSNCHRDFTSPEKTPSGWSSAKYGGRLQHAFAATVRLSDLGPVSDALVGRGRWDSPNVVEELDLLFSADAGLVFQRVEAWRNNARERYEQAFHMLIQTEKAMFGHNSFFLREERGLSVLPSFCDPIGTVVGVEAERREDDDGEMDTAEDAV